MAIQLSVDDSSWKTGKRVAETRVERATQKGLRDVGDELLRLSQLEVPLDVGTLQGSGNVEPKNKDLVEVGYNTPYAARLHEHPEYHFQNNRKGKYLTDPLKKNKQIFIRHIADVIRNSLEGYGV